MRINLYDAGQSVSHQLGAGGAFPTTNVAGGVHYADHLVDRHVVLPFIFDATAPKYGSVIREYDNKVLVDGDSMATHWLYGGTKVTDIVAHVKKATDARVTLKAQLRKVSDNAVIGTALTIPLTAAGYVNLAPAKGILLTEDAYLDVSIAGGNLHSSCFSLFVELTYFNDQHECGCARIPCEVEFPDMMCAPS